MYLHINTCMTRELIALQQWIAAQPCEWLQCTFNLRDGPRFGIDEKSKKRVETALRWTIDACERKFNAKQMLRFLPFYGGEPNSAVHTHIHALLERREENNGISLENHLSKMWQSFARRKCGQQVEATVWTAPFECSNWNGLKYFCRYEGATFISGIEKVILEEVRLSQESSDHCHFPHD